jgi:hypothetical protein
MIDAELIDLIQWIQAGGGTEAEQERALTRLVRLTGCPEISDYIFFPGGDWFAGEEPTAEEIAAHARASRAVRL